MEKIGGVSGGSTSVPGIRGEVTYRQAYYINNSFNFYNAKLGGKPFNEFRFFRGITTVYANLFYLTGLSSIIIPEGVTELGMSSLRGNSMYVELPSSLQTIGSYVFYQGTYTIKIYATTPPTLGVTDSSITKIYVPTASVNAYKAAAGWSTYASVIEGF